MEKLGGQIQAVLTTFGTKFTKMKSDNELFEERVNKQLEQVQNLKVTMKANNSLIGQTLA